VSGKGTCGADSTSTGAGVRELAVAGPRVAWIVNLGGNTQSGDSLYTASLARSADLGRVAVLRPDGTVGLYAASGMLLRAVSPCAKDVALRKDYLVVLPKAGTLEISKRQYRRLDQEVARTRGLGSPRRAFRDRGLLPRAAGPRAAARDRHGCGARDGEKGDRGGPDRGPRRGLRVQHREGAMDIGNVAFVPLSRVIAAVS
jgi:hypothetical protein